MAARASEVVSLDRLLLGFSGGDIFGVAALWEMRKQRKGKEPEKQAPRVLARVGLCCEQKATTVGAEFKRDSAAFTLRKNVHFTLHLPTSLQPSNVSMRAATGDWKSHIRPVKENELPS